MTGFIMSQAAGGGSMLLGSGMKFRAAQLQRQREHDAIEGSTLLNWLIAQQEAEANNRFDRERAQSLVGGMNAMPQAQAQAQQMAAERQGAITAAAGPTGQGMGTSSDGLSARLCALAQQQNAARVAAQQSLAAQRLAGRSEGQALNTMQSRQENAVLPLLASKRNAAQSRLALEQWLNARLAPDSGSHFEKWLTIGGNVLEGTGRSLKNSGGGGMMGGMGGG